MHTATGTNASHGDTSAHNFCRGLWRLADPKISLASFASLLLATCAAAAAGPLHIGWLVVTVLGIFALEVAKNASGEIFDFDSGTDQAVEPADRSPFSGGKRVLVEGLLTRGESIAISTVCYLVGLVAGFGIVLFREPGILWIGLMGVACAYLYHAPPFKLSYRGFGELAVAACYGPLIALGTFMVQRGAVSHLLVWAAIPLGLLIAAFLWINEFPDYLADRAAGKRTLVVRLDRRRASRAFGIILLVAFVILGVLPLAGAPVGVLLGAVALFPGIRARGD
jgi:1,4-dihydroxy-2-naphthoate octaprenyltransferase